MPILHKYSINPQQRKFTSLIQGPFAQFVEEKGLAKKKKKNNMRKKIKKWSSRYLLDDRGLKRCRVHRFKIVLKQSSKRRDRSKGGFRHYR